jgi:peptidoglycan/LPS O-acetylase OafA/YrhL
LDRQNNFDVLRLVAAASVIFSHAFLLGEGKQDLEPLMRLTGGQTILGVVGVFTFFTISGFLVTQSFEATRSPLRFLIKRALRIYPGLVVCVLVLALLVGPSLSTLSVADYLRDSATHLYVATNITMVMPTNSLPGVYFSGFGAGSVINGPLWTLPCEIVMYLMVFGLGVVRLLDLRIMAALFALGLVGIWFDTTSSDYVLGSVLWLLPFFVAGMTLYRLRDKGIFRPSLALIAIGGLVLSVPFQAFVLAFPLCGSYLILYLALNRRLPVIRAARYGDLSYGLYIYGWPVEQVLVRLNGGTMGWLSLFAAALPITAVVAFLSWHLVEARALRLKPGNTQPAASRPLAL